MSLFFRQKIREEESMTFLLAKRETKKRWPTYKNIWALSLTLGRGKDSYHSNMDLNIQGIMLYYNQTNI